MPYTDTVVADPKHLKVTQDLEEDIIFGRLEPGERLREDALLQRFGGTRHYIRQALAELGKKGMVTIERNRGATVRSFTSLEVEQVYEVREMLLRQAALRMDLPAPTSFIARLEAINADYAAAIAAGNLRGIHEKNDLFHRELFKACPNLYLQRLLDEYMDLTLVIRAKNLADPKQLHVSLEHHKLMIDYLKAGDAWLLAELCVAHVRASRDGYLSQVRSTTL